MRTILVSTLLCLALTSHLDAKVTIRNNGSTTISVMVFSEDDGVMAVQIGGMPLIAYTIAYGQKRTFNPSRGKLYIFYRDWVNGDGELMIVRYDYESDTVDYNKPACDWPGKGVFHPERKRMDLAPIVVAPGGLAVFDSARESRRSFTTPPPPDSAPIASSAPCSRCSRNTLWPAASL